jgi:hypothetical protein
MTARTDRIAKLTALIPQLIAANQPNRAAQMQDKLTKFSAMTDDGYNALMDLNRKTLETGIGPSGLKINDVTGWRR